MFAEERQLLIAELVADDGRVTVSDLAERFHITPETIRRDLDALETTRRLRAMKAASSRSSAASTAPVE